MRIEISRILHTSFAIACWNYGSHNFSANTDYQLIYTKRTTSFAIACWNYGSHNFSANTDYQLIYTKRTLYNNMLGPEPDQRGL